MTEHVTLQFTEPQARLLDTQLAARRQQLTHELDMLAGIVDQQSAYNLLRDQRDIVLLAQILVASQLAGLEQARESKYEWTEEDYADLEDAVHAERDGQS